jgi:hypothetical protein
MTGAQSKMCVQLGALKPLQWPPRRRRRRRRTSAMMTVMGDVVGDDDAVCLFAGGVDD